MTSYLAALSARELVTDTAVASPAHVSRAGAIAPRHVGRYEPWAMPVPETVERDAFHSEPVGKNDAAHSNRTVTSAVIDPVALTVPLAPLRGAAQPSPATHETSAPSPRASNADDRADPVVPRAIDSVPAQIRAPHPLDRALTPLVQIQLAKAPDKTPERTSAAALVPDARRLPAPVAQVMPVMRSPVSVVVTPRRVEARDTIHEAVAAPSQDASPSVIVTIGRIEVRAVPAPVAPRAVRGGAPTMSLDDYLRERTRGLR